MTKRIYLAVLFLCFTATTHANYDRLRESLEPVMQECVATKGAIGSGTVMVNLYCSVHDYEGEIAWIQKKVFINLLEKTRTRENGRFTLLD